MLTNAHLIALLAIFDSESTRQQPVTEGDQHVKENLQERRWQIPT